MTVVLLAEPEAELPDTAEPSASRNDPADADRLVAQYAPLIYRLALNIVNDAQLAEDVVQEVIFKAWRNLHTLRDPSLERSWILRIAHNTAVSIGRKRRELMTDPSDLPDVATGLDPQRISQARVELAAVSRALDSLDDRSRSIVLLREFHGLPFEEIGEVLGLPDAAVRSRLFRARRQLQAAVKDAT